MISALPISASPLSSLPPAPVVAVAFPSLLIVTREADGSITIQRRMQEIVRQRDATPVTIQRRTRQLNPQRDTTPITVQRNPRVIVVKTW